MPVSSPTATDSAQSPLSEAVVPPYTNPSPAPSSDLPVSPASNPPPSLTSSPSSSSPHTLAEQNSNSQSTSLSCVQGMYKYTGNIDTDINYEFIVLLDQQEFEEQLFSPTVLRLWRTGADYLAFTSEEDIDLDVSLHTYIFGSC